MPERRIDGGFGCYPKIVTTNILEIFQFKASQAVIFLTNAAGQVYYEFRPSLLKFVVQLILLFALIETVDFRPLVSVSWYT